jgi:hypothetical protein
MRQKRGPKVRFPAQFPHPDEVSAAEKSKDLIVGLFQARLSAEDFISALFLLPLAKPPDAIAILAALQLFLVHFAPPTASFLAEFGPIFVGLISHDSECVRRASFGLAAALAATEHFSSWLALLAETAQGWPSVAKQCFLGFAESFRGHTAAKYAVFVPLASQWALGGDRTLAESATNFLSFIGPLIGIRGGLDRRLSQKETGPAKMSPPRVTKRSSFAPTAVRVSGADQGILSGVDVDKYLMDARAPLGPTESESGCCGDFEEEEEEGLSATAEFLVLEAAQEDESVDYFGGVVTVPERDYLEKLDHFEDQKEAIEYFARAVSVSPAAIAGQCRALWVKLGDLILSDDGDIEEAAMGLCVELFCTFSQQLSQSGSLMIASSLNFLSSAREGLAAKADRLLSVIAEKAPRSQVFQLFIAGTKHKTGIARCKAATCLGTLIRQSRLDDRDFSSAVKCLAPLLRDSCSRTKIAAKTVLEWLSVDGRFAGVAASFAKTPQEVRELTSLTSLNENV